MTHIAKEPVSMSWCHAVMNLQFTLVRYLACIGKLRSILVDFLPLVYFA